MINLRRKCKLIKIIKEFYVYNLNK